MSTMQDHTKVVVQTGKELKANQAIVPEWMAKLDDNKEYEVTKLYAPFGTYVLAANEKGGN